MKPTFAFSGHVTAAVASRLVVAPPFANAAVLAGRFSRTALATGGQHLRP